MEEIIKELGKRHKVLPNLEFDGKISDFDEYKFINSVLIPVKDHLWDQAVKNVAAEIYDGDLFVIHDSDRVFISLREHYPESIPNLATYYTGIIDDSFKLVTIEDEDYYENSYEKISVDTLCTIASRCFVNDLNMLEDNIKNQLILLTQNAKYAEELFIEKNNVQSDLDLKQIISRIKKTFRQ